MPTYDYRCTDCDSWSELSHSMSECDDEHLCACGGVLKRILKGAPSAFFFGPGFACTDGTARANVGRNPHNQNRYSND